MSDHTNKQFDAEMEAIRSGVLSMGGIVEQQATRAIDALEKDDDARRTDAVGADEAAINQLQITIDQQCAQIIAKRQPTAVDLRMVLTVSKIVNDLERIGDEVKKIAYKAAQTRGSDRLARVRYFDTAKALDHAMTMLRQLISYMMEDPLTITPALEIVFIAKSIERVGDHAKNIAEAVVQVVKGKDVRHASADEIRAEVAER